MKIYVMSDYWDWILWIKLSWRRLRLLIYCPTWTYLDSYVIPREHAIGTSDLSDRPRPVPSPIELRDLDQVWRPLHQLSSISAALSRFIGRSWVIGSDSPSYGHWLGYIIECHSEYFQGQITMHSRPKKLSLLNASRRSLSSIGRFAHLPFTQNLNTQGIYLGSARWSIS